MANVVEPTLLRETDKVAVWETFLRPGDSLAEHDHDVGYVVVVLEGERIAVIEPDGDTREVDVQHGNVLVGGRSPSHTVKNVGSVPYREIMVELK